jgi:hypothetical protein
MKITVTREDIRAGIQRDCERCPVALAIKRAINENVIVLPAGFYKTDHTGFRYFPENTYRWIRRYDKLWRPLRWLLCRPFTFELDRLDPPPFH